MRFKEEQLLFLSRNFIARISTCNKGIPHVSPIYFCNDNESIFFSTEISTIKYNDLMENPLASIVVDEFDADWLHGREGYWTEERAIVIFGNATIFHEGREYDEMRDGLLNKYPDFRSEECALGTPPIIRVEVRKIWEHRFPKVARESI